MSEPAQTAVLVIDVQHGLFDDAPRPYEADAVIERINALTARARAAGAPVAFIQHERAEGFLAAGSPSWELVAALHVEPGDHLIRKRTPDSFLGTDLQPWLVEQDVARVAVCGYATEFCVDTTTRRAAALGYDVVLAADAHTTHDKDHATAALIRAHHNATLANITSFAGKIAAVPAAAVML
jgi:nicotinamidase-related amidase